MPSCVFMARTSAMVLAHGLTGCASRRSIVVGLAPRPERSANGPFSVIQSGTFFTVRVRHEGIGGRVPEDGHEDVRCLLSRLRIPKRLLGR